MGRPPINMSVIISSTQDSRFAKPRNFRSIPAVSKATEISLRAVRNAYHSGRTSIKKASGKVYTLKWLELVTPIDTSKCYYCHRDLTVKDRSTCNMSVIISSTQDSRFAKPRNFHSIPAVSKATGISLRAVRNAYHSGRTSIKKASGEVYTLKWLELVTPIDSSKCYYCHRDLTVKDRSTCMVPYGKERHQTIS